jgi:hypothetical protein
MKTQHSVEENSPVILHIDLGNQSIYEWIKENQYVIFSELVRYGEKMLKYDLDTVQAIMVSNLADNIVFILTRENLDMTFKKAMVYFLSIEEYEQCSKIKDLQEILINKK